MIDPAPLDSADYLIATLSVCWLIPYSVLASFSLIAKVSLYMVIPPFLP